MNPAESTRLNYENMKERRQPSGKKIHHPHSDINGRRAALGDIGNLMIYGSNASLNSSKRIKQEKSAVLATATTAAAAHGGIEKQELEEDEAKARKKRRIIEGANRQSKSKDDTSNIYHNDDSNTSDIYRGNDTNTCNLYRDDDDTNSSNIYRGDDKDSDIMLMDLKKKEKIELCNEPRSSEGGAIDEKLVVLPLVDHDINSGEIIAHELDANPHPMHDNIDKLQDNIVADPLDVVEYVEDINDFYRRTESCVEEDYMKTRQPDINERMRSILIDWLIEVHLKFKFMAETLFLAVNVIDRFLACSEAISRKDFQLVGITAIFIASKYHEIWAPEVQDLAFISANAYTRDDILRMEKDMLNKLGFNLSCPTPYVFLARFLKVASTSSTMNSSELAGAASDEHHNSQMMMEMMASFLLELCLTEYSMVSYPPSLLAAAAVYAAALTLQSRSSTWSLVSAIHSQSGYAEERLRNCALKMVSFHRRMSGNGDDRGQSLPLLRAVHNKYSKPNFHSVATLDPLPIDLIRQP